MNTPTTPNRRDQAQTPSVGDELSTLADLKTAVAGFCDERDWAQFHTLKNLAMALAIEAAELQELFLWKSQKEVDVLLEDPQTRQAVADELADVLCYLVRIADVYKFDLATSLQSKMIKNAKKYPVEQYRGRNDKYNAL